MAILKRNRAKCLKCGDIIESTDRHDFKQCKCEAIFVDGGLSYIRRGGYPADIEEMCEWDKGENTKKEN